jgi:hypothetical protein
MTLVAARTSLPAHPTLDASGSHALTEGSRRLEGREIANAKLSFWAMLRRIPKTGRVEPTSLSSTYSPRSSSPIESVASHARPSETHPDILDCFYRDRVGR